MPDTPAIGEAVLEIIASDGSHRSVRVSTVIDSSGLGALVAAYSSAKSGGASLRLSNLRSHSNQLLQMTKLLTVFEVSNTEAEAVRSFPT